jgi:uncharacterized protein involved in cysteine biosynthesis
MRHNPTSVSALWLFLCPAWRGATRFCHYASEREASNWHQVAFALRTEATEAARDYRAKHP